MSKKLITSISVFIYYKKPKIKAKLKVRIKIMFLINLKIFGNEILKYIFSNIYIYI